MGGISCDNSSISLYVSPLSNDTYCLSTSVITAPETLLRRCQLK